MSLFSKNNNPSKKFNIKSLGIEGLYIVVLGIVFVLLEIILSVFINEITLPPYFIYSWLVITMLFAFLLYNSEELRKKHGQIVLFYFGIGIMATVIYLQFLNQFADNFIYFYWTMAVSISLGITNFRLQIQIWAIPLIMVLIALYFVDIPESEKLRFYIWNPVITIMSCFGVYNSVKTTKENRENKKKADKYEFEYENLLESMPTMVVIKDDKNTIIRVNQKHAEMLGKDVNDFTNLNLYDFISHEEAFKFHKDDLEIINTGQPKLNIIEKLHLQDLDKEIWVRIDKKPYYNKKKEICGVMIFSQDITMEVAARAEKENTEAQFEQVFSEAPFGFLLFDSDNKILQVNPTFEKMTGFDRLSLVNQNINQIIKKEVNNTKKELDNILNGFEEELIFKTKSGDNFIGKMSVSLVNDSKGNLDYSIGLVENITEKKNAEKKLADYSVALQQSNKDLEQFAYAASHDLKEPLRMVNSYVTLISKMYKSKLDERGLEFIGYVSDGVRRMDGLISDLLEYSRVGRSQIKNDKVIFVNLIMQVMNTLKLPINEKNADLQIEVDLLPFKANKTLISMLFQNIIGNGIKYNENQPIIVIKGKVEDGNICFSISDNGIGIEQKFIEKVFEVFQRLHSREQYEGSGIGLAICKRIVQKHGGELWLESEVGVGSTFHFTIPFVEA